MTYSEKEWSDFVHKKDDVNFTRQSHHHTIGIGQNEAASGAEMEKLRKRIENLELAFFGEVQGKGTDSG